MKLDLQDKYLLIVQEICERILSAEVLSENINNIVFIESTSLQIRKILELIAYLSVLVNQEKLNYEICNAWHAKKIIEALNIKTTIFYPFPSYIISDSSEDGQPLLIAIGYKHALSQDEFIKAYSNCGKILHTQHPLKEKINIKEFEIENKNLLNSQSWKSISNILW